MYLQVGAAYALSGPLDRPAVTANAVTATTAAATRILTTRIKRPSFEVIEWPIKRPGI